MQMFNYLNSELDKNYKRPIQALHENVINLIKEIKAYLLPRNVNKLSLHKIRSAPLYRITNWNIPTECEMELASINFKRNKSHIVVSTGQITIYII